MKAFVIVNLDGTISISRPNLNKFGEGGEICPLNGEPKLPWADYPSKSPVIQKKLSEGASVHMVDASEIPHLDECEEPKQRYWDAVEGKVKIDSDWTRNLMSADLIVKKHKARLDSQINSELEKDNPNMKTVFLKMQEKDSIKDWNKKRIYEQAITNINDDGHSKSAIVTKLQVRADTADAQDLQNQAERTERLKYNLNEEYVTMPQQRAAKEAANQARQAKFEEDQRIIAEQNAERARIKAAAADERLRFGGVLGE